MWFSYDDNAWKSSQCDDEAANFTEETQIKLSPRSQTASSPRNDPLFTDFSQEATCKPFQHSLLELHNVSVVKTDGEDINYLKAEDEMDIEQKIKITEGLISAKPEFEEFIVNSLSDVLPSQEESKVSSTVVKAMKEEAKSEAVTTSEMIPTTNASNSLYREENAIGKYPCNNYETVVDRNKELPSHLLPEDIQHLDGCRSSEHVSCPKVEINRQIGHKKNAKNIFSSNYCPQKMTSGNSFREHLKQHTSQQDPEIHQTALSTVVVDKTGRTNTDKYYYECSLCGKSFRLKQSLAYHVRGHTGEKPFTCHLCSKSFHRSFLLKRHLKIHFRKKSYPCPKCNIKFSLKIAFNSHVKRVHNSVLRNVQCEDGDITFPSKQDLHNHLEKEKSNDAKDRSTVSAISTANATKNLQSIVQDTSFSSFQRTVPRLTISYPFNSKKRISDIEAIRTESVVTATNRPAIRCCSNAFLREENSVSCNGKCVCSNCEKVFSKKIELHYHYVSENIHHLNYCSFCQRVFRPKVKINKNFLLKRSESIIFTCMHCPKRFTNEYFFKDHLNIHWKQEASEFHQNVSSNVVEEKQEVIKSSNKCGPRKRYECYLCGKSFLSKKYLKIHFRTHTGERPFQCHICSKSFHRSFTFRSHLKIHLKKLFPCPRCNLKFALKIALNSHIKRDHKSVLKQILCEECGLTFPSIQDLQKHLELKRNSYPRFQSTLTTTSNTKMTKNLQTTVQDWPYQCGLCGKTFVKETSFQSHLRDHSKQKNWKCGDCKKSFEHKSGLEIHERTHRNEPLFNCKYCQKGFIIKESLISHLRTHSKEKPIKCRICGKGFAQFSDRTIHERRHTRIRPYNCKQCGKSFFTKRELKFHSVVNSSQPPM